MKIYIGDLHKHDFVIMMSDILWGRSVQISSNSALMYKWRGSVVLLINFLSFMKIPLCTFSLSFSASGYGNTEPHQFNVWRKLLEQENVHLILHSGISITDKEKLMNRTNE